ncbi:MAG TPA: polysaccharide biosynthesis/export family protein [Kofleriaceae bacterium]
MRAVGFVFVLGLLLLGCPGSLPFYDYAKEPDPRNKELILGVGDIVAVNVWENKDLNTETTIRPDGTITIPLVGDLKAAGETPSALKEQIKKRLTDFVKLQGTEITVAVKEWKSYRFTIQGEVVRQGVFTSEQFVTVADAIAMAGGPTRFAKRSQVKLFRPDPKSRVPKTIPLDYEALSSGKRLDMNIFVLPGDTIFVP